MMMMMMMMMMIITIMSDLSFIIGKNDLLMQLV
jgi:hypothetical protein